MRPPTAWPTGSQFQDVPEHIGFVLFDAANWPIYFNREALRVLAYPHRVKSADGLATILPLQIRSLLDDGHPAGGSLRFHSGRRLYVCRVFPVTHGVGQFSRDMKGLLLERAAPRALDISEASERFRLTPRECQTARFLMEGLTSKEIASRMSISPNTVKTFVRILMMKMEVPTRSGIVGKLAGA